MSSAGSEDHTTQLPNGSFCGTPSSVTSARPAPEAPIERNETDCAKTLVDRLLRRVNSDSPGTCFSAWSNCGDCWICCSFRTVVEKAALPTGSGGRAVITTVSGTALSPAAATSDNAVEIAIAATAPQLTHERNRVCDMMYPPAAD